MNRLRDGALKLGIELASDQLEQFETYYHELIAWNEKVNLTSITDYEGVQLKHFLDSLSVIAAIRDEDKARPRRVVDIGTGAGLPAIPLKIVLPQISLVLLEATGKKTKFLEHITAELGLKDVAIVAGRAEEVAHQPEYREKFGIALSRAVAPLPTLVELVLPFCTVGGYFIAQKKGSVREEVERAYKAITLLGGDLREVKPMALEGLNDDRFLVIVNKIEQTPPMYPRRPGMPAKRPI
jgi:16S rRNA (guanine527-N7)-methyltransferase